MNNQSEQDRKNKDYKKRGDLEAFLNDIATEQVYEQLSLGDIY